MADNWYTGNANVGWSTTLEKEGDYVVWGPGIDHCWQAEKDSIVITVRWPSIPWVCRGTRCLTCRGAARPRRAALARRGARVAPRPDGHRAPVIEGLTDESLDRHTEPVEAPGWPEPRSYPVRECLLVILNEEWEHRLYAERDLDALKAHTA
jgi:hypothetical protein